MTAYCAVVKYPIDADLKVKRRELVEGLTFIAMELVAEHNFDLGQIESAFEDAQSEAEFELEMKAKREANLAAKEETG